MRKSFISKLIISIVLFCFNSIYLFSQCGWVGGLNTPSGPINAGSEYLVNFQVFQNGVTNSVGQGGGISCNVHFGKVSSFGGTWTNVQTLAMNYDKDTGNNDEYKLDIGPNLTQGLWEYTGHCYCSGSADPYWIGGSNAQLTVNASLPVKFSNLNVTNKRNINIVNWSTAFEFNNDFFDIQHSTDGLTFKSRGKVKGQGHSTSQTDYSFNHEDSNSISYYRLRQVDFDGSVAYSSIVSIRSSTGKSFLHSISPNPTNDVVSITGLINDATYMISDFAGRHLLKGKISSQNVLSLVGLDSGFYILTVVEGDFVSTHKLIKQ